MFSELQGDNGRVKMFSDITVIATYIRHQNPDRPSSIIRFPTLNPETWFKHEDLKSFIKH